MSKLGNYLGLSRKANYLIIGSDNIKSYSKKMYLIIVPADASENVIKIAKKKANDYNIKAIKINDELSKFIGLDGVKIVALKNKGLSDAILKCENEYSQI